MIDENGRAVLIDFGLSRYDVEGLITSSNRGKGAPRWMAPELLKYGVKHTEATDMWAFGMVIYVCQPSALSVYFNNMISGNLDFKAAVLGS